MLINAILSALVGALLGIFAANIETQPPRTIQGGDGIRIIAHVEAAWKGLHNPDVP